MGARRGPRKRGRGAEGSGTTEAQLGRDPGTPEKGGGGPLPWADGRPGLGPGAGGGGTLAQTGKTARLVLQRLLLEEDVETKRLVAAARACRAPGGRCAPRLDPARPHRGREPQAGDPGRGGRAGAHPRAEAAEPGLDGGPGLAAGLLPAAPAPWRDPARVTPGVGRCVGDAGCLPALAAPSPAGDGRLVLGLGRACCR